MSAPSATTAKSPALPKNLLGRLFSRTIHNELVAIFVAFIVPGLLMLAYFQHQLNDMRDLSDMVNQAGRLRMISQHAALLTLPAAAGDSASRAELALTVEDFATTYLHLDSADGMHPTARDKAVLNKVNEDWSQQKNLSDTLMAQNRGATDRQVLQLTALASATLKAADANVLQILPRFEAARQVVRIAIPTTSILGVIIIFGLLTYIRRRLLRPLKAIDTLLMDIAKGNLSARLNVGRHDDEINALAIQLNNTIAVLEQSDLKEHEAIAQLRDSETRNRTLWEIASDAIITLDESSTIRFANPAVQRIFGYMPSELIGKDIAVLQPEELRAAHRQGFAHHISTGEKHLNWNSIEIRALHHHGHEFPVELTFSEMRLSEQRWFVGTFRDITERKRHEEALHFSANFDALTELPNRTLLFDRLDQAINQARRQGRSLGVLYIDLDNFKVINDSLGHDSGDELLREAARRLLTCVRDGDTVARIGGDEFAVLLSDLADEGDIDLVAQRSLTAMSRVFHIGGSEGFVGASIGASVFPTDGKTRAELLQHADIAMYRAKEYGRNNYQRFAEHMQARYKMRLSMEAQLRRAVEANELVLHYQPQIDLASGRVIGAEALVRWESPSLGRVSPVQFIPLAEETGLIVPIGEWIIQRACRDAASWVHTGAGAECSVAINLSARQFSDSTLIDTLIEAIADNRIPTRRVEVEITESLVMENPEKATAALQAIKNLGCHVALDDFGTGYSSLAYLRHFPLDVLKIDKSLIQDVAIVRAVIQLARSFGLRTLAEGVEDEDVLSLLRHLGCDIVQGYYYSRPLPLPEFIAYLEKHHTPPPG
jgi:diguanylate cyclase (GGDEF)-like protein/PAS domain S-box-containing protein